MKKEKIYTHSIIIGEGYTKEEAAYNFVQDMVDNFPSKGGLYDLFLRVPLIELSDKEYDIDKIKYQYRMRCSTHLNKPIEELKYEDLITGVGNGGDNWVRLRLYVIKTRVRLPHPPPTVYV